MGGQVAVALGESSALATNYDEAERTALALAEATTRLSDGADAV